LQSDGIRERPFWVLMEVCCTWIVNPSR
jgi:hypothetical protein